ncbi:recombinase family protein [Streptomyces sp. IBSBF 2953]|jgi:DNA invertase Pin-like site-specific DNA recombinase|nr:recombinase family protein [Pseudomonas aeruginosa]ELH1095590.1 recombinase family protein [Pseudomonas aeruginosa]ELL4401279.1 recombinase family protein [Pseudomonas aeruginosa]ELS0921420.1 recombinase family protein [Pseudomonas aeruginosa]MCQ9186506.1 recombinase family protein [Streptomyces hayashii]
MRAGPMKVARIYMRVSTKEQDIRRQEAITESARQAGYYIAGVYRDTESGVRYDRPELLRMIADLGVWGAMEPKTNISTN